MFYTKNGLRIKTQQGNFKAGTQEKPLVYKHRPQHTHTDNRTFRRVFVRIKETRWIDIGSVVKPIAWGGVAETKRGVLVTLMNVTYVLEFINTSQEFWLHFLNAYEQDVIDFTAAPTVEPEYLSLRL